MESHSPRVQSAQRLQTRIARLARDVAIGVLLVTGGLSIGGFFAGAAWPFELMCHFRQQYFVILLGCTILQAIVRGYRWMLLGAVLAGMNGWTLWPYLSIPETQTAVLPKLEIVSTNVFSGNQTPQKVLEYIEQIDPDLVVAVEVTPEWEERLSVLDEEFPHQVVQSRAGNFGIALYSRLPLVSFRFAPLSEGNSAIVVQTEVDGTPVTLIAAHPYPPGGSRNTRFRNVQLAELARLAAAVEGPCLLTGDLNVTPFSPAFQQLLTAGELSDPRLGTGLKPTWPAGRRILQIPIDHCLVGRVASARINVGPDVGSDHYPIAATIWLPAVASPAHDDDRSRP
jgi:endonuclease/exonuclease/phosphatase (EEP) superfamily protein YafD